MDLGGAFLGPIEQTQRIANQGNQEARAAELQPAILAQRLGAARMSNAEASQLEQSAAAERAVAAKLAEKMGTPTSTASESRPISAVLTDIGKAYAESGAIKKAEETYKAASLAAEHESAQLDRREQHATQKLNSQMNQGKFIADLASGVKNAEDWKLANDIFAKQMGKSSPFADRPYDPKFVEGVQKMGTTMAQKASEDMAERRLARQEAEDKHRDRHQDTQDRIAEARLRRMEDKDKAERKVGVSKVPGKDFKEAAMELLKDLVGEDQIKEAAFDVAADAESLMEKNRGLSASEALRKTIQDKREAGDFKQVTPQKKVFGINVPGTGGDKKGLYAPARAYPKSGRMEDLERGVSYKDSKGNVRTWNGKGWDKPAAGKKGAAKPDDTPDDDGNPALQ